MTRHLSSLVRTFGWSSQPGLNAISTEVYSLPAGDPEFCSDDYFWLNNCLKDTIQVLRESENERTILMLEQLIKYQQVI